MTVAAAAPTTAETDRLEQLLHRVLTDAPDGPDTADVVDCDAPAPHPVPAGQTHTLPCHTDDIRVCDTHLDEHLRSCTPCARHYAH